MHITLLVGDSALGANDSPKHDCAAPCGCDGDVDLLLLYYCCSSHNAQQVETTRAYALPACAFAFLCVGVCLTSRGVCSAAIALNTTYE